MTYLDLAREICIIYFYLILLLSVILNVIALGCWSLVFDILMYTILLTIAYVYDYCIYLCI